MLTPQLLEAINGTLLGIFLGLMFFFSRYILLEFLRVWRDARKAKLRYVPWNVARRNRAAAISMLMVLTGESLIRGHVWAWRHYDLAPDNRMVNIGVSIGVLVCIVGGICALRHFAPDSWGNAPWIMIPLISLAFGIGMAMN